MNYTLSDSVLLRGNWVDGPISWTAVSTDDPDRSSRVITQFGGGSVRVRVAMRDAELFSLSMGCVQKPKYAQCHWAANCSAAWGAHYQTIPCGSDAECRAFGTCGGVLSECVEVGAVGGSERVCVVGNGSEPGPLCGWF